MVHGSFRYVTFLLGVNVGGHAAKLTSGKAGSILESMTDLKAAKKLYKQTRLPMGIYRIKNLANGKIYIGRSADLNGKLNSEKFQLKNNLHMNKEMQSDFNAVGEGEFVFEILDLLQPAEDPRHDPGRDLQTLEEMWLDKLQPFDTKGYHKRKP